MGLKAIREKGTKTVYYPSLDSPDRIAFKIREASWAVRKKINNYLNCRDQSGREFTLAGDMMETVLRGCVVDWSTVGSVEIPEFSEENIFELPWAILAFLFGELIEDFKKEAEESAKKGGATSGPN